MELTAWTVSVCHWASLAADVNNVSRNIRVSFPVTLISPNMGLLPQPSGFLHHLYCSWWDCAEGECRLHRRSRVSREHFACLYSCSRYKLSLWDAPAPLTLQHIWSQPSSYSSMMFLVIRGCTWLCVLSPGYTGCNRRNGPDFGRVFLMLNYTEKP